MKSKKKKNKGTTEQFESSQQTMNVDVFTTDANSQLPTGPWIMSEEVSVNIDGVNYVIYVPEMLHKEVMGCMGSMRDQISVSVQDEVQLRVLDNPASKEVPATKKTKAISSTPPKKTKKFDKKHFQYDPHAEKFSVPPQDILIPVPPISPPPETDNDMPSAPFRQTLRASQRLRDFRTSNTNLRLFDYTGSSKQAEEDPYLIKPCGLNISEDGEWIGDPPQTPVIIGEKPNTSFAQNCDVVLIEDDDDDIIIIDDDDETQASFVPSIKNNRSIDDASSQQWQDDAIIYNTETIVNEQPFVSPIYPSMDSLFDDDGPILFDDGATDYDFCNTSTDGDDNTETEGAYSINTGAASIQSMKNYNSTLTMARSEIEKQQRVHQLREHLRCQQQAINSLKHNHFPYSN